MRWSFFLSPTIDGYNFPKTSRHWLLNHLIKRTLKKNSQKILTPSSSAADAKKIRKKSPCKHFGSVRHNKKWCYVFFFSVKKLPGWKSLFENKHLLKKNVADVKIAKSVKSMKMALKVNSMLTKEIEFYINYITDFHLIYD